MFWVSSGYDSKTGERTNKIKMIQPKSEQAWMRRRVGKYPGKNNRTFKWKMTADLTKRGQENRKTAFTTTQTTIKVRLQ